MGWLTTTLSGNTDWGDGSAARTNLPRGFSFAIQNLNQSFVWGTTNKLPSAQDRTLSHSQLLRMDLHPIHTHQILYR